MVCKPSPDACIPTIEPVVGCDCLPYDNACEASIAGVDIACTQGQTCPC